MSAMTAEQEQLNTAPTCVNHPKVETRLTCSSCGDPICARCMVTTVVGQKCPRCARQSARARGAPEVPLVARAFGAGLVVAFAGGFVLVKVGLVGLLLAALLGFVVGEVVRRAAKRRVHTGFAIAATAALPLGMSAVALLLSVSPLAPQLLLFDVVGAVVAYLRASGTW
jgi:uncharacterized paraquat-inducible protein A